MTECWHVLRCKPSEVEPVREGDVHGATTLLAALPYEAGTTVCRVRLHGARQAEHRNVLRGTRRELVWAVDAADAFRDVAETIAMQVAPLRSGTGRHTFLTAHRLPVNKPESAADAVRVAFRSAVYPDDYGALRGVIYHARLAMEMAGRRTDELEDEWSGMLEQEVMSYAPPRH